MRAFAWNMAESAGFLTLGYCIGRLWRGRVKRPDDKYRDEPYGC